MDVAQQDSEDQEPQRNDWLNELIMASRDDRWNEFFRREISSGSEGSVFQEHFGGMDVHVTVPEEVYDELTGLTVQHDQVAAAMQLEVQQLENCRWDCAWKRLKDVG